MDAKTENGDRLIAFRSPKRFLSDLEPSVTAKVVASAADIALIIDKGIIKDVALGNGKLCEERYDTLWRGKPWVETVTSETRQKVQELLKAPDAASPPWRQVNHPSSSGVDVPVRYTAIRTGRDQQFVAVGRDLRSLAVLQQRLIEAHQGLERDYDRMRAAEARYRLLFQFVSDAIVIVDASSDRIEEVNPAAAGRFGQRCDAIIGDLLSNQFTKKSLRTIEITIAEALSQGSAVSPPVRSRSGQTWQLAVSPFKLADDVRLIVRLVADDIPNTVKTQTGAMVLDIVETMPDGFAIVSETLSLLTANRAFATMAGYPGGKIPENRQLGDFLGRSDTDLNVLMASLRRHGSVRNFSTIFRDRFNSEDQVEVSAISAPGQDGSIYGFAVRSVARRLETGPRIGEELPSSVDQVTSLVGKVPLKEIIRESSDLIEKLCIEAALEITADNRASAAEMLGLSRQGLYSKLKRFGMDD